MTREREKRVPVYDGVDPGLNRNMQFYRMAGDRRKCEGRAGGNLPVVSKWICFVHLTGKIRGRNDTNW
jgi:hypothetical protein